MTDYVLCPVDNLDILQNDLLIQLKEIRPDIFINDITRQIITVGYVKGTTSPALAEFEHKLELQFGNILNKTFWVTGPRATNRVHVDGTSTFVPNIKLMFPVINCQDTQTIWFNYTGQLKFIKEGQLEYLYPTDEILLKTSSSLTLLEPVWARIDKPHTVFNYTKNIRIICSYVFENQNKLLKLFE